MISRGYSQMPQIAAQLRDYMIIVGEFNDDDKFRKQHRQSWHIPEWSSSQQNV